MYVGEWSFCLYIASVKEKDSFIKINSLLLLGSASPKALITDYSVALLHFTVHK